MSGTFQVLVDLSPDLTEVLGKVEDVLDGFLDLIDFSLIEPTPTDQELPHLVQGDARPRMNWGDLKGNSHMILMWGDPPISLVSENWMNHRANLKLRFSFTYM